MSANRFTFEVLGTPVPAFRAGLLKSQQTGDYLASSQWVSRAKATARQVLKKSGGKALPSNVTLEAVFFGAPAEARRDDLLRSAIDAVIGVVIDEERQIVSLMTSMLPRMYPATPEGVEKPPLITRERTVITVINLDPLQAVCE